MRPKYERHRFSNTQAKVNFAIQAKVNPGWMQERVTCVGVCDPPFEHSSWNWAHGRGGRLGSYLLAETP